MCNHDEMRQIIKEEDPTADYDVLRKIREGEILANSTFFGSDYIPERFRTGVTADGRRFPKADDVINYLREENQTPLFEEEEDEEGNARSCMSAFNICE